MRELPFIEDIYDMEAEELQKILSSLNRELQKGPGLAEIPSGMDFEKFERKALKLTDCLELELEERA